MRDYDDLLMVRYSVLALCTQRTNDGRGSRQLTSFSLAMGFRDPNLLRAAVIGERPKTLQSSRADPHRRPGRRLCQLLAQNGHGAMSDLSPLCGSKQTCADACLFRYEKGWPMTAIDAYFEMKVAGGPVAERLVLGLPSGTVSP